MKYSPCSTTNTQPLRPLRIPLNLFLLGLLLSLPLPSLSRTKSHTRPLWLRSAPGKKQFHVYYDAGHLGSLPCTQQQAYLNNCVDDALLARVDREATGTTPVYSAIQGLLTCMDILDNTFLEINPIHLRRKQFFDARQKEGSVRHQIQRGTPIPHGRGQWSKHWGQ